jgi:hypothetical protein
MPREEFKREVEKHLTVKDTEPWELLYFEVYKSQLAVIEEAVETASLMLGGQKARGYCLEMICADFLADSGRAVRRNLRGKFGRGLPGRPNDRGSTRGCWPGTIQPSLNQYSADVRRDKTGPGFALRSPRKRRVSTTNPVYAVQALKREAKGVPSTTSTTPNRAT